jgi:hypothetical protein
LTSITFPVGVARRFFNVTWDEPDREHILMAIIGGNRPALDPPFQREQPDRAPDGVTKYFA